MRSFRQTPLWLIKYLFIIILLALPLTVITQPKELIPVGNLAEITLLKADSPNPVPAITSDTVLCNCWAYVKSVYPQLPGTNYIDSHLSTQGSVAVFYYANVGLYHYAIVTGETDHSYLIEETNYKRCQKGSRTIPKNDPSLLGFFPI